MTHIQKLFPILLCLFGLAGCSAKINPFSPEQKIENNGGKIEDLTTNTNGIIAEIGNIKNKLEIQGSQLRDLQDGLLNVKIGGDNLGTQILSGDGGLISIFSVSVVGMLLFYFYYKERKVNKILSSEIKSFNDLRLHENIIRAAAYTNVEKKIYNLIYKN